MPLINTNLESEFNMAPLSLTEGEVEQQEDTAIEIQNDPTTLVHYKELDKIEAALPQVMGLDATDAQLDELAEYGIQAHKDLMELAMNIEQRFAGDVASSAGAMLGHAINARTNKIKKKLDMIALQLKKQLTDHKTKSTPDEPEELEGDGKLFDRNEILNHLLGKPQNNTKS
jgi:hypothetical protein